MALTLKRVVFVTENPPPPEVFELESPRPLHDREQVKKLVWWIPLDVEAYKKGYVRVLGTGEHIPDTLWGNIHEMYDE